MSKFHNDIKNMSYQPTEYFYLYSQINLIMLALSQKYKKKYHV